MLGQALDIEDGELELNYGKKTLELSVENKGSYSVAAGASDHFSQLDEILSFDRKKALGMHLDLADGEVFVFEPGHLYIVSLVSAE